MSTAPAPRTARIAVAGLKVALPLAADALPPGLVPMEGPAPDPTLELALGEGALIVRARLNGKNYRRMLKTIAEHGADRVLVVLQGNLKPSPAPGAPFVLEGAGFQVTIKPPRPAPPEGPA